MDLSAYKENVTSQFGEDGVLAKVLETIGQRDRWCVEFGAWDGKHLSNTYRLIAEQRYSAVLIEASCERWQELRARYQHREDVLALRALVGFEKSNNLDTLLAETDIPQDFDLLSVDIDGNDYHVWEAVSRYRPKVVCIEYNPTIPNEVEFVQPRDMSVSQGNSLLSLTRLARQKHYELVAVTDCNGIFVDAAYYPRFEIADNSLAALRPHNAYQTHAFIGFDGRLFLRGNKQLLWHGLPIDEAAIQPLPRMLRGSRERYSRWQSLLYRIYRRRRRNAA